MREQPSMETGRLILRPFMPHDAGRLEAMGNDPDVSSRTSSGEVPRPGAGQFWIENRQVWWDKGEAADFAITLKETGEAIGIIGLGMEYLGDESMQLSFWIGRDYWNNGYVTEAALAMLPFGFDNLNLHRIYARHFTTNPAGGRVLEKILMTYEGTLREAVKKNGIFENVACYGILSSEYKK